jgi:hypothetical protein
MTTVVTQLKFPPELKEKVERLTTRTVDIFSKLNGFVSMEINLNPEGNSTLSYLQWKTFKNHENRIKDPVWDEINPEWNELMSRDHVNFQFPFVGEPKWTT